MPHEYSSDIDLQLQINKYGSLKHEQQHQLLFMLLFS